MKIKFTLIVINIIFLIFSVLQMFPIPPHADNMKAVYKSGYFEALDRECSLMIDAFISIKTMSSNPSFAWTYLNDLETKNDISATVFDYKGRRVASPGLYFDDTDETVLKAITSYEAQNVSRASGGDYHTFIPVFKKPECSVCHSKVREDGLIGVFVFEQDYDAHIYYSRERVLIFFLISIALSFSLFLLTHWQPGRPIKEMFDKD